ncbi:hypothetical protein JD969_04770 [Planctomycetota bacterium]|nr:hypothetical protein JD969_04770 [Planctomycetota bacterium]
MLNNILTKMTVATFAAGIIATPQLFAVDADSSAEEALPEIEQAAKDKVNGGKITLFGGIDAKSAYYSKGLKTEDEGAIIQPWIGLNINIFDKPETSDFVKSLDVYGIWWGSIHSNRTDAQQSPESFYESDYGLGVTAGLQANFTVNAEYWFNSAPNGGWDESHDLNFKISYDDADIWDSAGIEFPGFAGLQPYFKTTRRLKSEAPNGKEFTYFWVGINPTFDFLQSETIPVTFSTPLTIGFGDGDYYSKDTGNDFGYVDVGIRATMPLDFISEELGNWSAYAGFNVQYIGDAARADDTWVPIGSFGLSFSY